MAVRAKAQQHMDEEVLDDEVLDELLQLWQRAKDRLQPYREEYDTRNGQVKAEIEERHLEPGAYRCGVFVLTIGETESREVQFTRKSARTLHIKRATE